MYFDYHGLLSEQTQFTAKIAFVIKFKDLLLPQAAKLNREVEIVAAHSSNTDSKNCGCTITSLRALLSAIKTKSDAHFCI
jgi:hypothetical protein